MIEERTEPNYKYSEARILAELKEYIDSTYGEHYSEGDIEVTEYIISKGHGLGHVIGNIIKYASRYGHKSGRNRKDILKTLYYSIMWLHVHDQDMAGADALHDQLVTYEDMQKLNNEIVYGTVNSPIKSFELNGIDGAFETNAVGISGLKSANATDCVTITPENLPLANKPV